MFYLIISHPFSTKKVLVSRSETPKKSMGFPHAFLKDIPTTFVTNSTEMRPPQGVGEPRKASGCFSGLLTESNNCRLVF